MTPNALLTKNQGRDLAANLHLLSDFEKIELLNTLTALENQKVYEGARQDFLKFIRAVDPTALIGPQHRIFNKKIKMILAGTLKRLNINIPPRHSKSMTLSYLFPAWYLGKFPNKKVMMASHTAELAVDFGRKVRNLVGSEVYKAIFPDVSLSSDSKAAGRWNTNHGGEYFATGAGANLAGRGADLCILDDIHSEQDGKTGNLTAFDNAYTWYQTGPRQRLQPEGIIVNIMTRWHKRDLTGRLVENMMKNEGGDVWDVVELPMELPSGEPLWPQFWSKDAIAKLKATLDVRYWQAQFQQDPTSEEGALLKREWWREWTKEDPPKLTSIIQSWDTAFEKNNRADFSVCTTWGVFEFLQDEEARKEDRGKTLPNLILLDVFRDRLEFPELKQEALELYDYWKPDNLIIEKKASGAPLIYELRARGIPATEFTPSKGNDKVARVNAVSDLFSSGIVWAPPTRWAQMVIEECAAFPAGEHDDIVDSVTLALMRFRQGGYLRLPSDEKDKDWDMLFLKRRAAYY